MAAFNYFKFVGKVYKNAQKHITEDMENGGYKYYTTLTLICRSNVTGKKNNYIPIRASGEVAEKAYVLCRNGNTVAVEGEIVSREWLDKYTGETSIQITFLASDVMLIKKPIRTKLSLEKYKQTVELASIDEYEAPKVRHK